MSPLLRFTGFLLTFVLASAPGWAQTYSTPTPPGGAIVVTVGTDIPAGTYTIFARGADGGNASTGDVGGSGATVSANFDLVAGDVLRIAVGQVGATVGDQTGGGGGGGSAVVIDRNGGAQVGVLIAAGAGGGAGGGATLGTGWSSADGTPGGGAAGPGIFTAGGGGGFNNNGATGDPNYGGGGGEGTATAGDVVGPGGTSFAGNANGGYGFGGGGGGDGASPDPTARVGGGGGGYGGGDGGGSDGTRSGQGGTSYINTMLTASTPGITRTDGTDGGGSLRDGQVVVEVAVSPPAPISLQLTTEGWIHLAVVNTLLTYDDVIGPLHTQGFPNSDEPSFSNFYCNAFTYDPNRLAGAGFDSNGDMMITVEDGFVCLDQVLNGQNGDAPVGTGVFVYGFGDQDGDGTSNELPFGFSLPAAGLTINDSFDYSSSLAWSDSFVLTPSDEGYNDLGNVFDGDIDWDLVPGGNYTNLTGTVYVYDPANNGGDYRTRTSAGGDLGTGALTDGLIPRGQGFFVQATAAGPTLTVPSAAVVTASQTFYGRQRSGGTDTSTLPTLGIQALHGGEPLGSPAFVWFHDEALVGYDRLDANRLSPVSAPMVATYTVAEEVAVLGNALPPHAVAPGQVTVLPLGVAPVGIGGGETLSLVVSGLDALPDGVVVRLEDTEAGETLEVHEGTAYSFAVTATSSAERVESRGPGPRFARTLKGAEAPRFRLHLDASQSVAAGDGPDAPFGITSVHPNPTTRGATVRYRLAAGGPVTVTVHDALGREVAVLAHGPAAAGPQEARVDDLGLAPGVYVVRLMADGAVSARPLVVVR